MKIKMPLASIVSLAFLLTLAAPLRAGQYFQDFSSAGVGATSMGDGSTLFSTQLGTAAAVQDVDHKELQLTAANILNTRTAFLLPDLDAGTPVYAFSAKWNSQVYGNFPNAADGFSFNFGQLAALNLIDSAYAQEAGYPIGLGFSVRTFTNGNPGFYLRVNGTIVATITNNPTVQWGTFNSTRHFFEVDWNLTNGLSVKMDNQILFSNVTTFGFAPKAGDRFVWAARSGALSEEVRLDNIVVMTGGNLVKVGTTAPYYSNQGNNLAHESDKAFDSDDISYWTAFSSTAHIGASVGPAKRVTVYALTSASTGGGNLPDPRTWTFEATASSGSSWTACGTGTGSFLNRNETRAFLATNAFAWDGYRLNVSANNGGGSVALAELRLYEFVTAPVPTWQKTAAREDSFSMWNSVFVSADGTRRAAVMWGGGIYTNVAGSSTWGYCSGVPGFYHWQSIAGSADGKVLIAGAEGQRVYISKNFGATWAPTSLSTGDWYAVACSADGSRLIAGDNGGNIFKSYTGGNDWGAMTTFGETHSWTAAAIAANADVFAGGAIDGFEVVDRGASAYWKRQLASIKGLTCSANGNNFLAIVPGMGIYSGFSSAVIDIDWTMSDAPASQWTGLAASADGQNAFATVWNPGTGGPIYSSANGGANWTLTGAPAGQKWTSVACSADGNTAFASIYLGGIWSYESSSPAPSPLTASTLSASDVTPTSATIAGQITPGRADAYGWLEWGTTTNYGNVVALRNVGYKPAPTNISFTLANLSPNTTYHFRVRATNVFHAGDNHFGAAAGADQTFATPGSAPSATTLAADQLTLTGARLNGQVNPNQLNTFAWFQWGTTTSYGNGTAPQSVGAGTTTANFSANLSGLAMETTYHFRVVATNLAGTSYASDFSFTTPSTNTAGLTLPIDSITPTTAESPEGQGVSKAIDANAATKYLNFTKLNSGFTVTPSYANLPVRALSLISADDFPDRDPASFALYGSSNGVDFTLIASNAVPPFAGRHAIQTFTFANAFVFPIYRVIFPTVQNPDADSMQIAEVELLPYGEITAGAMVNITPPGDAIVARSYVLDSSVDDTNKLEVWEPTGPTVVDITPAAASMIKGWEWIGAADDATFPGRTPSFITVSGFDGTNYTILHNVSPQTATRNMQIHGYTLPNTKWYQSYRFTVGAPISGNILQMGELRLFGETLVTAAPLLSIHPSGGIVLVSWTNTSGFNLESKTNLSQLNWAAVTNAPVLSNGVNTVTIPMSGAPIRFFQLRK